jgi:hypothetical protein
MEVLVRYQCWDCGSSKEQYEDLEIILPIPLLEQWNLCPYCQPKAEFPTTPPWTDKDDEEEEEEGFFDGIAS